MTEPKQLLHELPKETVRLLGSSQVITSVFSVVKELIENSLDAGATSLELRLENYGLDKIELRDNGAGIPVSDVPFVAKKYHTSKITSFSDLEDLVTYGFRGEALGSLCNVSDLSITTRTKAEEVSSTYSFNHQGQITSSRPSHLGIGTTITAVNLFKNLPVRRQFYNTNKKKKDELKRIEDLLLSYGIVSPSVRISLRHNKDIVWQKNQVPDVRTAILETLGKDVSSNLQRKELSLEIPKVGIELYLPSLGCDWTSVTRSTSDRGFVFVNHRPVQQKEVEKMIRSHLGLEKSRYPVFVVSIVIPPSDMDVNVEPNKTRVFLHRQEAILELLEGYLIEGYDINKLSNKENHISLNTEPLPVEKEVEETSPIAKNIHIDSETEVNTYSMVTAEHQVKVIAQGDKSLIDTSLPVFRITLEQETKVQNESTAPSVVDYLPCIPMTLQHSTDHGQEADNLFKQKCADGKDTTKSGVELGETTEHLDMPIVPNNVVTPEVTMERSEVKSTAENNDLMEDSLSELLSSWPEKADSESVSSVSTDRVSCDNQSSIPSGEQWSRGQGLKSSSGKAIEPVTILNHGKRPLSPEIGESPPHKRRSMEMSFDESRSFSTPQKQNAFKLFAKMTTPKVMTANPEYSDSRISEILMETWDKLSASEKTTYELKAGAQNLEKGGHKPMTNHSLKSKVQKSNLNTSVLSSSPSIKEQLMRNTNRPRKQQGAPRSEDPQIEKTLPFSIKKLRQTFSSHPSESQMASSSCWQLIGPLKSCGMWTCYHDYKIHILNPHRVHETVLYHRLMKEHVLPSEALERPMRITQEVLGNLWEPFKNLAIQHKTTQMFSILQDRRFTSNGIQIKLFFDAENEIQAEISALPACIPTYGIEDVKEILELIYSTGTDSIAGSRPLKVINFLKSEAVRMARQLPRQQDYDDMVDLLCQVEELLPKGCKSCLHDKLFLHAIFDLNNIPLTQYSQEEN